jgi:hypothetical protein
MFKKIISTKTFQILMYSIQFENGRSSFDVRTQWNWKWREMLDPT